MFSQAQNPFPVARFELRLASEAALAQAVRSARQEVRLPVALHTAAEKRQREWLLGRYCARQAFRELGQEPPSELIAGPDRAPVWPAGIVGSLTHTEGYVAAAIARRENYRGLGIDSERIVSAQVASETRPVIVTAAENALAERYPELDERRFLSLIFSAKESLYKCLAPTVGRFFSYEDAAVREIDSVSGRFRIELLSALCAELSAGFSLTGAFQFDGEYVHTALLWDAGADILTGESGCSA